MEAVHERQTALTDFIRLANPKPGTAALRQNAYRPGLYRTALALGFVIEPAAQKQRPGSCCDNRAGGNRLKGRPAASVN